MATLDHSRQPSLTALVTTTRVLLILLFTLVEVVALVIWIDILQGNHSCLGRRSSDSGFWASD